MMIKNAETHTLSSVSSALMIFFLDVITTGASKNLWLKMKSARLHNDDAAPTEK